jgi:hypothetical protein
MNKEWKAHKSTVVTLVVALACFLVLFAAATPSAFGRPDRSAAASE